MRLIAMLAAVLAAVSPAAMAAPASPPGDRLDHILLWGRSMDEATSVMAAKLGFQVRPGRDPEGVGNRYVRLADGSFVELLAITRPELANAKMDPGARGDQAQLHGAAGARTFGIHSPALEAAHALLAARGFAVTPVFTAAADDPDGLGVDGPRRWRLFALDPSPLTSRLFLIDYAPGRQDAGSVMDDRLMREHPNGAQGLSAVWLVSDQLDEDRRQLARMGFEQSEPVRLPQLGARGYSVAIGSSRLLLLAPDGEGAAAQAARHGGNQILGISIGVVDLDRAQRRVERGYERFGQPLARYHGLFGEAFMAPTMDELGVWVEFHAMSKAKIGS